MIDLSTFLLKHPPLSPDVLHRIELFRASMELEVQQTVGRVRERKRSPYTGEDMGARLSMQAVREIEDTVIAFCSKLYEVVAREYVSVTGIEGDLTALFEEMAGAALMEAQRLFRNATAGMWFEGDPSLAGLRLHKEQADKTPYHEIADFIDPEPSSIRVASVVCERIERLRDDATTRATRLRVEYLKRLRDQNQAVIATPPEAKPTKDSSQTSVSDRNAADLRTVVDEYIEEVSRQTGRRITRTNIWRDVGGYKEATELERYQRRDTRLNKSAKSVFDRILSMNPNEFVQELNKRSSLKFPRHSR